MKTSPFTKSLTATLLLVTVALLHAEAATFTVTTTADTGPGSLRQAVIDAKASTQPDTIVFDPGVFSTPQTITLATELRISDNSQTVDTLTINGPGAELLTISGNGVSRIFLTIANDTTSISGMTLTKGAGNNGGAISNGGILTLTNMNFVENVTNSGGAIYNSGNGTTSGVLNVVGCTFTNNQTTGTNINGDGGSAIENNSDGKVTISNSTMAGGITKGGGGAIRNEGVMEISDTIIENHTSGSFGNGDGAGAIYSTGQLTLTNCIIRGNTAGGGTNGGGLINEGQMTLIGTVVSGNTATGEYGGGIYEGSGSGGDTDFLRIINSTIANNVANADRANFARGGGIYAFTGCNVTIEGSTISGNEVRITATPTDSTESDGGGIWSDGLIRIDRSTIALNKAGEEFGGLRLPHTVAGIQITNSTIGNNTAPVGGGMGKDDCNLSCATISIGNTVISGNTGGDLKSGGPGGTDSRDAAIASLGYNLIFSMVPGTLYAQSSTDLIGVDPKFGPLQDNGGPTFTLMPQPDSPVIDKGKRLSDAPTDQRGVTRPFDDPNVANAEGGDGSEIGSFEFGEVLVAQEKTLANIATRLPVQTGENVMIGGFILFGEVPKLIMVRALGPSLAGGGVTNVLLDPNLELYSGDGTLLARNEDWQDEQRDEILATNLAPTNSSEAAILRTVEPGPYTAIVRGRDESTGVGLVEVYDLDQRPNSKLANISTRGVVGTQDNRLIGGFIVGPQTRIAVRAVGPSLGAAGITGALQDPLLELVNANGEVVRANDNWKGTQRAELEALGLQPADDRESAIIATLPAGAYTAVVGGVGENGGVGLVEVYNLP